MEDGGTRRKNATCKVKNEDRKDVKKKEIKERTSQQPKDKDVKRNDTKMTKKMKPELNNNTATELSPFQYNFDRQVLSK